MNNKSILIIIGTLGIYSISNAQSTYQKYDSTTRGVEYNITKSQINSNKKTMELLKESKKSYSVFDKNHDFIVVIYIYILVRSPNVIFLCSILLSISSISIEPYLNSTIEFEKMLLT